MPLISTHNRSIMFRVSGPVAGPDGVDRIEVVHVFARSGRAAHKSACYVFPRFRHVPVRVTRVWHSPCRTTVDGGPAAAGRASRDVQGSLFSLLCAVVVPAWLLIWPAGLVSSARPLARASFTRASILAPHPPSRQMSPTEELRMTVYRLND